jgi:hypothetical protein
MCLIQLLSRRHLYLTSPMCRMRNFVRRFLKWNDELKNDRIFAPIYLEETCSSRYRHSSWFFFRTNSSHQYYYFTSIMHVFVLEILLFKNFAHLRLFWNLSTRTTKKQSRKETNGCEMLYL